MNYDGCREGILSTPAVSAVIRKRKVRCAFRLGLYHPSPVSNPFKYLCLFSSTKRMLLSQANGGFIMSASHNPGGPEYDWGIKVNA